MNKTELQLLQDIADSLKALVSIALLGSKTVKQLPYRPMQRIDKPTETAERIRAVFGDVVGEFTMDQIIEIAGIDVKTKAERRAVGFALSKCNVVQRRTSTQRYYVFGN